MITRKDFLNGMAATIGAALLPRFGLATTATPDGTNETPFQALGISETDPRYYPPRLTGMRGSHPGSYLTGHAMRDGVLAASQAIDTGESYDLVVVGGGISGLASAYYYRKHRPDARILILDNHDDFGGHAKRNEFTGHGGRLLVSYGGSRSMEYVAGYSDTVLVLLREIGVEPQRFYDHYDRKFRSRYGLSNGVFFDREHLGKDALVADTSVSADDGPFARPADLAQDAAFLARSPLADEARQQLLLLQTKTPDYLAGLSLEEKSAKLKHVSYADFLRDTVKVHPDVIQYFQQRPHGGYAMGIDGIDAMSGASMTAPGLMAGLGFETRSAFLEEPYIFHFPDGNASIARLLVRSLIDGVARGRTMEDIADERFNYAALDRPEQPVRLRLNSTVISARNTDAGTTVTYLRDGKAHSVRGKATVLACWHAVIPYLCPELPERQKAAMHACVKIPIVYAAVQIKNWRALQSTGVGYAYCPGAYFSEVGIDYPVSLGGYRFSDQPDDSCILQLVRTPCAPGLPARDQFRAGRAELYATPFSTFEDKIKDQLDRMFRSGGFRSERDILAITVNRWAHGYTYYHHTLWDGDVPEDERIHVVSRARFGNIAIANTDAGGDALVPYAIEQAHRATNELLG